MDLQVKSLLDMIMSTYLHNSTYLERQPTHDLWLPIIYDESDATYQFSVFFRQEIGSLKIKLDSVIVEVRPSYIANEIDRCL